MNGRFGYITGAIYLVRRVRTIFSQDDEDYESYLRAVCIRVYSGLGLRYERKERFISQVGYWDWFCKDYETGEFEGLERIREKLGKTRKGQRFVNLVEEGLDIVQQKVEAGERIYSRDVDVNRPKNWEEVKKEAEQEGLPAYSLPLT